MVLFLGKNDVPSINFNRYFHDFLNFLNKFWLRNSSIDLCIIYGLVKIFIKISKVYFCRVPLRNSVSPHFQRAKFRR